MPFLDFFGGIVLVVFGIDPGYAIVGWGAINFQSNTYKTLGYGAIETVAGTDFNKRLEYIYDETYAILNRCRPDALAIEKLYFQTNQKTAINVAQARGVTLLAAQKLKIPIFEYTPLQVKTAVTGYGKAKKPQVMEMTARLLKLKEIPKPDDTCDALAIAIHRNVALKNVNYVHTGGRLTAQKSNVRKGTLNMLYSVRGKLIAIESNAAVVECGGVGYMCQTTMNTLKAVKLNTEVTLYTYLNVREDAVDLFGFATKAELETFKNLISVSGVGPKAGLAVLSELSPEQVAMAIASDDLKTITRAQGIGKKIAQRIVLELKDKLAKAAKEDSSFAQAAQNSVNVSTGNVPKAIEALGVLGYSPSDVSPVLATLDSALPVEQLISLTLKQMGRQ